MQSRSASSFLSRLSRRPFLVTIITLAAIRVSVVYLDRPLSRLATGTPLWLHNVAEWVTQFGRSDLYLWPLGFAIILLVLAGRVLAGEARRRTARFWAWAGGFLWLSMALAGLLNDLVKLIAGRPRPMFGGLESHPLSFGYAFQSFPSGHAAVAFALAFSFSLLWPRARWPLIACAVAVAASRVILNVHFLGDVMGGALAGWLTVEWLWRRFLAGGLLFRRGADGAPVACFPSSSGDRLSVSL